MDSLLSCLLLNFLDKGGLDIVLVVLRFLGKFLVQGNNLFFVGFK
jgi:hypothetical protein